MAKQITGWEARDGSFHRTERGAKASDAALVIKEWLDDRGVGRGGEWSAEMILRVILEDAPILSDLLKAFVDVSGQP